MVNGCAEDVYLKRIMIIAFSDEVTNLINDSGSLLDNITR
jgi:hypothetical protein